MRSSWLLAGVLMVACNMPALAGAASRSTCETWLSTSPSPTGLAALTGSGATQRAALLAAGGKLVIIGNRYYSVSIPAAFYTAAKPMLVFDLHGTGGYPEAEWTDWNAAMTARGHAFVALAWGGGTPSAATDTEVYTLATQIMQEIGANCPIASANKWLMGFSVGSAFSFAVMIRDVADQRLFRGQLAISGAAIGPLTTGRDVMHATVEANRSNASAVKGILSWMYCGDQDMDHGWSMCTEMPNGVAFVNEHGGQATLYSDPMGTHHSLPASSTGYNQMFDYMAAAPPTTVVTAAQANCVFDAAERIYPALFNPSAAPTLTYTQYRYRYYSGTRAYLGVSTTDEHLYYLPPTGNMQDVGAGLTYVDQVNCR